MQSSNLDSIGIKPSLFTDKAGEFSFCKDKAQFEVITKEKQLESLQLLHFIIKTSHSFARNVFLTQSENY